MGASFPPGETGVAVVDDEGELAVVEGYLFHGQSPCSIKTFSYVKEAGTSREQLGMSLSSLLFEEPNNGPST